MKAARVKFSAARLQRLFKPLRGIPKIAIAVSGGGDSLALLHLARAWGGPDIVVLTIDHALRSESAKEARQVAHWCRDLGIEHHTLKWKHAGVTSGLQAKARAARYDLMTAWCVKQGVAVLLTAHTADDQAETVAMRQRRTQSAKSLSAIWPETGWGGIRIIRPLLSTTRAALRDHLREVGQEWIEDPSNSDSRFERVRIRKAAPSLALAKTAGQSQRKILAAQAQASRWIKRHVTVAITGMMSCAPGTFQLLNESARDETLLLLLHKSGGTPPDRARREALMHWLASDDSGRRTLGGVLFAKRKHEIIIAREPGRIDALLIELSPSRSILWDNRFLVRGPRGSTITSRAQIKYLKRLDNIPAFVDAGLPVIVRDGKVLADLFVSHHKAAKIERISN